MLNLSHSLIICSSLLLLMFIVAGTWGGRSVAGRMGVKNPYVKKGVLPSFSPKSLCSDVQSGFVLPFGCAQFQGLSSEGLQLRVNRTMWVDQREY